MERSISVAGREFPVTAEPTTLPLASRRAAYADAVGACALVRIPTQRCWRDLSGMSLWRIRPRWFLSIMVKSASGRLDDALFR